MEGNESTSIELLRVLPDDQKIDHIITVLGKIEARGHKNIEALSRTISKLDETIKATNYSNQRSVEAVEAMADSNAKAIDRMASAIEKMAGQVQVMDDRMDSVEKTLIELGRLEQAESDLYRLGQRIDESIDKVLLNMRDVEKRVNKLEVEDAEARGSRKWTDKLLWKVMVASGLLGGGSGIFFLLYKLIASAPKK